MTDAPVIDADAFRRHAQEIAAGRLLKARGLLAVVSPDARLAIEQAAYAVAPGVAECLLQKAARNIVFEGARRLRSAANLAALGTPALQ